MKTLRMHLKHMDNPNDCMGDCAIVRFLFDFSIRDCYTIIAVFCVELECF
jgi:hypothetical protein